MILREVKDGLGSRSLTARLTAPGDLVIEGQDLGSGVEQVFGAGIREYEWSWTVRAAHVPALLSALDAASPVLNVLRERFSDENAGRLQQFLDDHKIPYESWSRLGD